MWLFAWPFLFQRQKQTACGVSVGPVGKVGLTFSSDCAPVSSHLAHAGLVVHTRSLVGQYAPSMLDAMAFVNDSSRILHVT